MRLLKAWGPPLRIARRTARRSVGRTLLVAALIGLPVAAATWLGVVNQSSSPSGEVLARQLMGTADARVEVSQYGAFAAGTRMPSVNEGGTPAPAKGAEKPVRDPATFDVQKVLPAGSKAARLLMETGTAEVRGPKANNSVVVMAGDGQSPLTKGMFRQNSGRMPATPTEVAVSPAFAERLELLSDGKLKPDATMTTTDGKQYTVVGLAMTLRAPDQMTAFAIPGSPLAKVTPGTSATYLVDLPDSVDPSALFTKLNAQGIILMPRVNVVDPPPTQYGGGQDAGAKAVMVLVIGFGVLEIVLLAGTAFAVGARRQTRELGLVLAAGGTPSDIRRIVLTQGVLAGAIGALSGVAIALGVALAGRPLWERLLSGLIPEWQIPWKQLAVIAAIGLLAGLAAAIVPALSAGRQSPMAALAGRFMTSPTNTRLKRPAVVLLAFGIGAAVLGSSLIAKAFAEAKRAPVEYGYSTTTVTPTGPIALVLLGITSVIAALVWMLPTLVAKAGLLARALPLSARLALRDASRHRHRTGPATAAIMMAVAATAAASFAVANAFAAESEKYIPTARDGVGVIAFAADGTDQVRWVPGIADRIAAVLPADHVYEIASVDARPKPGQRTDYLPPSLYLAEPNETQVYGGVSMYAVDPSYLRQFGDVGRQAADALQAGKVVTWKSTFAPNGTAQLSLGVGNKVYRHPAVVIPGLPKIKWLQESGLISREAAAKYGNLHVIEAQFDLRRDPTKDELAAVAGIVGHEDMLTIEHGYQAPVGIATAAILGVAAVVTLLGVAISVALSAAEGRADLATLAAVGAPPRRRRNLAAAQAWVLGQLGCLLGVGVGALYGYTAHAAFGSPHFMIPWRDIAGIVIIIPLFAGALAWLATRSRLPMVRRLE
jgi:putative ABC transport system permease protein